MKFESKNGAPKQCFENVREPLNRFGGRKKEKASQQACCCSVGEKTQIGKCCVHDNFTLDKDTSCVYNNKKA